MRTGNPFDNLFLTTRHAMGVKTALVLAFSTSFQETVGLTPPADCPIQATLPPRYLRAAPVQGQSARGMAVGSLRRLPAVAMFGATLQAAYDFECSGDFTAPAANLAAAHGRTVCEVARAARYRATCLLPTSRVLLRACGPHPSGSARPCSVCLALATLPRAHGDLQAGQRRWHPLGPRFCYF